MRVEVEQLSDPDSIRTQRDFDRELVRIIARSNDMSPQSVLQHKQISLDVSNLAVEPEDFD